MGLKGINPVEQHVEKAFFALVAVAGLGVLAWQFVGKENTVKVGKDDVALQDAYTKIDEERRKTDAKLRLVEPEGLPKLDGTAAIQQLSEFEKRYQGPVSPEPQLASALDRASKGVGSEMPMGANMAALAEVVIPAPESPVAGAYMAAINPVEARVPEVAAVLPKAAPFDKAWISVDTTFDGAALKAALQADPDDAGPIRPMPKSWWETGMHILAVQAERQMLKPDGTWSDPEPVKSMPGRETLANSLDKLNSASELKKASDIAVKNPGLVRRPDFYSILIGEPWVAPSEREIKSFDDGDTANRIQSLYRQRTNLNRQLEAAERALKNAGGAATPPPRPPGGPAPAPGRNPGGGGGAPGRPPGGGGGAGGTNDTQRRAIQTRIDNLKREIQKVENELRQLGENVGEPATPVTPDPSKTVGEAAVLDNDSIRVWTHDVHVIRGAVYRYRLRLAVTNPYFGHASSMLPAQASMAQKGVWYTPMSEWSAPVRVDPETYLFFTAANEDLPGQRAAIARAEVYQFHWGYWRKGQTTMEPGDAVVAEVRIPDMTKMPAPAGPNDPNGGGGGGGGGGAPVPAPAPGRPGGRGAPAGGRDDGRPGTPTTTPTPAPTTTTRPVQLPMTSVTVIDPTILLGIKSIPGLDDVGKPLSFNQVYLREPDGRVVLRLPERERTELTYRRVVDSAAKGERETAVRPTDAQNPPGQGIPTPVPTVPDAQDQPMDPGG